jgi:peptidoglycan/xylan/chitin deacetylase (PgdA/CDA1 family)
MALWICNLLAFTALMLALACDTPGQETAHGAEPSPTPVATEVPATSTPQPTPTPTAEPTPVPTATPAPTSTPIVTTGAARVISRGPTDQMLVALTFDAGADRGFTANVLDVAARERVPISFGITGVWAERNSDLVARMASEGHMIINHSYDHSSFNGRSTTGMPLTQAQRFAQLDRAEALIVAATGGRQTKPFFRPPYGDYDASVNTDVGTRGYGFNVMWTIDSQGWLGIAADRIVRRCLDMATPGAIYVFHVGAASADAQALPEIITGLRERGYGFALVSQFVH